MKVDILAFGAHPDDVELGCGGTIALSIAQGKTVAIVDFADLSYLTATITAMGALIYNTSQANNSSSISIIDNCFNIIFSGGYNSFQNSKAYQFRIFLFYLFTFFMGIT